MMRSRAISALIMIAFFIGVLQAQASPAQVGVAAAVSGQVALARPDVVGHNVQSGEAIFLGDTISTDAKGRLQILLLDETVFTIGPNSAMVIDEFVYDPATDAGKVSASIAKGVFRFVSGRIAHQNHDNMKVKLPAGTIGVRGTIVAGRVDGDRSTVALVGPGSVIVSNSVGNSVRSVEVSRIGFGTVIPGQGAAPQPPSFVSTVDLSSMAQALGTAPTQQGTAPSAPNSSPTGAPQGSPLSGPTGAPVPGMPGQPAGPDGTSPGQAPAMAGAPNSQPAPSGLGFGPPTGSAGDSGQFGFQGVFGPGAFGPAAPGGPVGAYGSPGGVGFFGPPGAFMGPPPGGFIGPPPAGNQANTNQAVFQVADGISTKQNLRLLTSGVFHYMRLETAAFHQTTAVDRFGSIDVRLDIDFGARTIGGGNSRLAVQTAPSGPLAIDQSISIPSQSFATGDGNAIFTTSASNLTGTFTFKNNAGHVANLLKVDAVFDQTSPTTKHGEGTIDNIAQNTGPSP